MVVRDVNGYIAVSDKGKIKRKGVFVTYSQMLDEGSYHKSLSQAIVPEAIEKYFLENIPVEKTIMECENIFDFCKTFNTSHGFKAELVDAEGNIEPQQKTNRYYISTNGKTFRKIKEGKITEIEAGGKLVTIFNKKIDLPMDDYNIDYDYYINECYKIIHKIDGTEERMMLEAKIKKEEEKKQKEEENFLKYCINKVPTERQLNLYGKEWLIEKYGKPKTK